MNRSLTRAETERLTALMAEKRRRLQKAEHSTRGYRDEDGVWRGGLLSFVRDFWHVLEPATPFEDGWALEAVCEHLEAVTFGEITRLLINVPPGFMKSLLTDVYWPAWEWSAMGMPHLRYVAFSYSSSLTQRDNGKFRDLMLSTEFQELYGDKVVLRKIGEEKVSNDKHGWKLASSVGGVGTGERGDRIILDDPHNVKESESEVVRTETVRWFRESMSSRLNNMESGAKIVIMQRVNEEDVSGIITKQMGDYVHLMIQMEFDWYQSTDEETNEPYTTAIGWVDPRWQPDPNDCQGELAWPERFPESIIPQMKRDAGQYAWACNPYEAPILMADLSMRPIGTIKKGDKIVGFHIGNDEKRARFAEAEVLDIHASVQPTVRITLESGHVIRCTPDHKWWTARNDEGHPPYMPARAPGKPGAQRRGGSALRRVCPPNIDVPSSPEAIRAAGWVSGFFDGEGSVSIPKRRQADHCASPIITFTQGCGRNIAICEKLEASLRLLGFNFGFIQKKRKEGWEPVRSYWLKAEPADGSRCKSGEAKRLAKMTLYQKFLHVIQPNKWRERILHGALTGRVFTTHDRVISIEPDVSDIVYGLTTTTGNYVVWGLASSNSQYQQIPNPRGGGIFQLDQWLPAETVMSGDKFPPLSYVVASLDGAYTEKEENDPSALTIWGIFQTQEGYNRALLIHAWRKRLQFSGPRMDIQPGEHESQYILRTRPHWGLVEWVAYSCNRFKCDRLLIEAKASGISAAQSLRNSHGRAGWTIQLVEPKGDKMARALAVQPSFSQGMVYAPDREWAEMVQDEMAKFPRDKHDDLTDSVVQCLKHLRDSGLLRSDEDRRAEELEAVRHKGAPKQARYPGFRRIQR
jgi:predicted phage terminase large subunit-like protein